MSGQSAEPVLIRTLGQVAYQPTWRAMQDFTINRTAQTTDEIWLLEHEPVFTQGQAGKPEHLLQPGHIPVVSSDRGGQITYHGPGQLVAYVLLDLRRLQSDVRRLVTALEQSLVSLLASYAITAASRADAPGVYVAERKIGSLGLRIKKGCSFHGIALNIDMDLRPFAQINPCGHPGMAMAQMTDYIARPPINDLMTRWIELLCPMLNLQPEWIE